MRGWLFLCSKGLRLYRKVICKELLYYFAPLAQEQICNGSSVNNCLGCGELQDDVFWQQGCDEKKHTDELRNAFFKDGCLVDKLLKMNNKIGMIIKRQRNCCYAARCLYV